MVVNSFLKIFEFWRFDVHEGSVPEAVKASKSAPVAPIPNQGDTALGAQQFAVVAASAHLPTRKGV
jgi:hypothetical protein